MISLSDVRGFVTDIAKMVDWTNKNVTAHVGNTSLADVSKMTRVEPLTIVSKDLLNVEYMADVQNSLLSIFTAYYLQAISFLMKIKDVEVVRTLDRLNPNRDGSGLMFELAAESHSVSMESMKFSLPTKYTPAMEGDKDNQTIMEASNLSVGKLINVELCYDANYSDKNTDIQEIKSVTIPVNVRLMASIVPTPTIVQLLALDGTDKSLTERFHAWRAGRISFIKDLIFCQDLITEWKKASVGDDSGTAQEIMRRVTNAKKYGLLTANPSLAAASNIFVISETVAREIEQKLAGKLSNPRIRQQAFDNTYAMIIAVVDREHERVTFYIRGCAASTDLSLREIKAGQKGKGMDVMDLLKAMQMSSPLSM
jgi:hypothetical protein